MRQVVAGLAAAVFVAACGGGETAGSSTEGAANASTPAATTPAQPAAPQGTGTVHEIAMELRDGNYVFTPAQLTIRAGDTVRWTNVSGGPHNVAFWADSVPAGAATVLEGLLQGRTMGTPLSGTLLTAPNATFDMVFAGAPTGDYRYYCTPHLALGMVATITVQ